jgi:hypothetical protein
MPTCYSRGLVKELIRWHVDYEPDDAHNVGDARQRAQKEAGKDVLLSLYKTEGISGGGYRYIFTED